MDPVDGGENLLAGNPLDGVCAPKLGKVRPPPRSRMAWSSNCLSAAAETTKQELY